MKPKKKLLARRLLEGAALALALAPGASADCSLTQSSGSYQMIGGYTCAWSEVLVYCGGSFYCGYHVTLCSDSTGSSGTFYEYYSC
jgi:hypothetical protein